MKACYLVRVDHSSDAIPFESYTYQRVFRLQASGSDFLREVAEGFKSQGYKEVERNQRDAGSPILTLRLQRGDSIRLLTLCTWDFQES